MFKLFFVKNVFEEPVYCCASSLSCAFDFCWCCSNSRKEWSLSFQHGRIKTHSKQEHINHPRFCRLRRPAFYCCAKWKSHLRFATTSASQKSSSALGNLFQSILGAEESIRPEGHFLFYDQL